MSNPYPTDLAPFPLTNEDTDFLRQRLQTDETTLQNARAGRLTIQMQLASRDRVITALERSIESAHQALGDEPATDYPMTTQGDREAHAGQWGNIEPASSKGYEPSEPLGTCATPGCNGPLWPGSNGLLHAYGGVDCFPEQENSPKAALVEVV